MTTIEEALNLLEILNEPDPLIPTVIEEPRRDHRNKDVRNKKYQGRAEFVKRHNITDEKARTTIKKAQHLQSKTYRRKH